MAQIESLPHPLDDLIKREDSDDIPMTSFHYAHSQDLPFTLVIDVEITSNFISSDLVNILELKSGLILSHTSLTQTMPVL